MRRLLGIGGILAKFAPSKSSSLAKLTSSEFSCPEAGNAETADTAKHDKERMLLPKYLIEWILIDTTLTSKGQSQRI